MTTLARFSTGAKVKIDGWMEVSDRQEERKKGRKKKKKEKKKKRKGTEENRARNPDQPLNKAKQNKQKQTNEE